MSHITIFEFFASYSDLSLCHEEHRCIVLVECYIELSRGVESDIIELHRRKGFRCSRYISELSRNNPDSSSIELYLGDIVPSQCLVSRRSHLVLSREIDPELDRVLYSAHTRELSRHELIMQES